MFRCAAQVLTSVVVSACIVLAGARPAAAVVYTATLTAATPTTNGPCPFTETFNGSISGSQGTTFVYSFVRYIDGVQSVQTVGAATIPASGSMAVRDSFSIGSTSSGINFDQIWVYNISGGQADVYSQRASFSVSCIGAPPPSPVGSSGPGFHPFSAGASGHSAVQQLYGIPMPTNLKSTTDPHECGRHGGLAGVFCIQAVPDNYLILVWDWQGSDKWPAIDGYHVYDVTGGGKTRVQDQTNPQATVEFFKPGSYTGKCYAVSAYKGTTESVLSASFCAATAQVGVKGFGLQPSHAETHWHLYCGSGLCGTPSCAVVVCIGWVHGNTNTGHFNNYMRGYLQFDQSQIAGRNVYSARLDLVLDGSPLCVGGLGTANGPWVGTPEDVVAPATIDHSIQSAMANQKATFDVTSIVRGWATGGTNNGLVLFGTNENTGAEDSGYCTVNVVKAALDVKYY